MMGAVLRIQPAMPAGAEDGFRRLDVDDRCGNRLELLARVR